MNRFSIKEIITIIVPCYNEQESICLLHEAIEKLRRSGTFQETTIDILFVDDGSTDNTLDLIKKMAELDKHIRYISFSRNFGKEAAIFAGLENFSGDYCALMDADLQDPPDLLEKMFLLIRDQGYDCVATKRVSRKGEPFLRSFFARQFYKIFNAVTRIELVDGARDFRLMTRQVVEAISSLKEYHRFSKGLFNWVGFKVTYLSYENSERAAGQTKWSFAGLFYYSVEGILAFSVAPLAFVSLLGIIISFLSLLGIVFIAVRTIIFGDPVAGWPSLAIIVSSIGGLQLFCLGIIGQYLSKVYLETKKRPVYIVKETDCKN